MTDPSTDCLEAQNLELWRGERCLFSDLSLTVRAGQLLHVKGSNGSGKTSLLRVLTGLSGAEQGDVLWNGTPSRRCRYEYHQAMSYVGHQDGLHDDLTVLENLRWSIGLKTAVDERALHAQLDAVGLADRLDLQCHALSAGQRRRLALVRTTLAGSRLWILDEPLANLDVAARAWCGARVADHVGAGGLAVMTSHQDIALDAGETITLDLDE